LRKVVQAETTKCWFAGERVRAARFRLNCVCNFVQKKLADRHPRFNRDRNFRHICQFERETSCKIWMYANSCCDNQASSAPRRLPNYISGDIVWKSNPLERNAEYEVSGVQNEPSTEWHIAGFCKIRFVHRNCTSNVQFR